MNEFISKLRAKLLLIQKNIQMLVAFLCLISGISGIFFCLELYLRSAAANHLAGEAPDPSPSPSFVLNRSSDSQSTNSAQLVVYVSGAVKKPGLYELPADSRIFNALEKAGGLTSFADSDFIQRELNLAEKIKEGEKIYFPPYQKETDNASSPNKTIAGNTALISINSASAGELSGLPGIGEKLAEKIISARPYETIDDLLTKKVVGQSVFEKMKELIKN